MEHIQDKILHTIDQLHDIFTDKYMDYFIHVRRLNGRKKSFWNHGIKNKY